jgi:hypothetical protein
VELDPTLCGVGFEIRRRVANPYVSDAVSSGVGASICNFPFERATGSSGSSGPTGDHARFHSAFTPPAEYRLGGTHVAALAHLTNCPRLHSLAAFRKEEVGYA